MNRLFLASTLGNDPHTEGIHNASKIAKLANIDFLLIPPSTSYEPLCLSIKQKSPRFLGLSYRLTPEIGYQELKKVLHLFVNTGLIRIQDNVKICFAGLPETIQRVRANLDSLPLKVHLVEPHDDILDTIKDNLEYFEIKHEREKIFALVKEELIPAGIQLFDQLADEVVYNDKYLEEPPLPVPSEEAKYDLITRIKYSSMPLLRTHFGIPSNTIEPTVRGIKEIAEARVIDEISLGSSDLSQRYFGQPEKFEMYKNDGGVPYKSRDDLIQLFQASRTGNFPSVKPYCHVANIIEFINICLSCGMLRGAHQAIPLFWFNELDGRGPTPVRESIKEHFAAVRELVKYNIPVEMNDPNQWSSRWAHDTIIVTSYALITAVMATCGVKNMVMQMQFNKPKETGDYADLAKMSAAMDIVQKIICCYPNTHSRIVRETRTGIESLSANMKKAKWQLARSTLLQMCMEPSMIHIVSYCEANHAAKVEDVIDSSKLVRKAIKIYNNNKKDIEKKILIKEVNERKEYLLNESTYLLKNIAKLNPSYNSLDNNDYLLFLGDENAIASAIEQKLMSAPGILNSKYKGDYITRPMKYGTIDIVDNYEHPNVLTEKMRLEKQRQMAL
jgi:hypothetical protein